MKMDYINFLTTEHTEITEKEDPSPLTGKIIGAAIEIHRALGPGLLESAYGAPRGVHEPMDERSIRKGVPTHPIPSLEFEEGNFPN